MATVQPALPDLTWRPARSVWFRLGGLLQARYSFNRRNELSGESANTSRFSVPRARLILDGGLTDYLTFRVRIGALAGGGATFEQAYADVHLGEHLKLRGGIFYLPASVGDNPAPQDLQGVDYSEYSLQTSGGSSAGAALYAKFDRVQASMALSNGVRASFSEFAEPIVARFATTGRVEARLLTKDDFNRFDTESSFRGSDLALRVGAAAHYQQGRLDGTLPHGDFEQYTADVTLEGSGFNVIVAGRWLRIHPSEGNTTHDPGFFVQAGAFVHERIELWGRYEALYSDGKVHTFPDDRSGLRNDYDAVAGGINGYFIPRTNVAKLQADFQYVPGPINSTWAQASDNEGIQQTQHQSQWTLRTQLVLSY